MSVHSTLAFLVKERRLTKQKRRWITRNVQKRECVSFVDQHEVYGDDRHLVAVRRLPETEDENDICKCGRKRKSHKPCPSDEHIRSLDYRVFSERFPTDVIVEIVNSEMMRVRPMAYPPKQITRIAADTQSEVLQDFVEVWGVPKANFMVSLYGSSRNMGSELVEDLTHAMSALLVTLANPGNVFLTLSTTCRALCTIGLDACTSMIPSSLLPSSEIMPVTFLPWSSVSPERKDFLLRATATGQSLDVRDNLDLLPTEIQHFQKGFFLLADYGVDTAMQKFSYVFPVPLRGRMEDVLRQHTHDLQSQGSLMVLVGGAFPDMAAVHGAVLSGVPVIVIKNSGGAADVLDYLLDLTKDEVEKSVVQEDGKTVRRSRTVADTGWLQEKVKTQCSQKLEQEDFNRYKAQIGRVFIDCLSHRHLITVCDVKVTPAESPRPVLVKAAVEAFIKCQL